MTDVPTITERSDVIGQSESQSCGGAVVSSDKSVCYIDDCDNAPTDEGSSEQLCKLHDPFVRVFSLG